MALIILSLPAIAQCDKKVEWVSFKTERIDSSGNIMDSKDETVTLITSNKILTVIPQENLEDSASGEVKEISCNWAKPYDNGKTVIKTTLSDPHGDIKNVTVTIEARDGEITATVELEEMPEMKIKLYINKHQEKN